MDKRISPPACEASHTPHPRQVPAAAQVAGRRYFFFVYLFVRLSFERPSVHTPHMSLYMHMYMHMYMFASGSAQARLGSALYSCVYM